MAPHEGVSVRNTDDMREASVIWNFQKSPAAEIPHQLLDEKAYDASHTRPRNQRVWRSAAHERLERDVDQPEGRRRQKRVRDEPTNNTS